MLTYVFYSIEGNNPITVYIAPNISFISKKKSIFLINVTISVHSTKLSLKTVTVEIVAMKTCISN